MSNKTFTQDEVDKMVEDSYKKGYNTGYSDGGHDVLENKDPVFGNKVL